MGGERESVIQDKTTQPTEIQGGAGLQKIRIHESKGEVHFHDDKEKLKAAVTNSIFWSAWSDLKKGLFTHWRFVDGKNGTVVTVAQPDREKDVVVSIVKGSKLETFAALEEFVCGKT